jgi:hypothetical protein
MEYYIPKETGFARNDTGGFLNMEGVSVAYGKFLEYQNNNNNC